MIHDGPFGKPIKKDFPLINITSLIDVMFLLLIFLIITTTFNPHLGISLQLPEAKSSNAVEDVQLCRIIVDSKGVIYISEGETKEPKSVTLEELESRLKELKAKNPPPSLVLESDAEVPFRTTVKIFDLALQLGYSGLTIATIPKNNESSSLTN
ncbi:MAG TPA: biopolymer transporter ExbD [Candidatus Hydrogenedens sp.]|nr:biopolymer transporter ExbD [Candidatus Hydrogenedens sp.]HOL19039.1 biopolymer transporter ExbD [Candidatus Hydrogenedens sp.]HPP57779.1 biopolymer transporter ExbD [Candidatus Hydrogenedens sp.]